MRIMGAPGLGQSLRRIRFQHDRLFQPHRLSEQAGHNLRIEADSAESEKETEREHVTTYGLKRILPNPVVARATCGGTFG